MSSPLIPMGLCELCRREPWHAILNPQGEYRLAVGRQCSQRLLGGVLDMKRGRYTDFPGFRHDAAMALGTFEAIERR